MLRYNAITMTTGYYVILFWYINAIDLRHETTCYAMFRASAVCLLRQCQHFITVSGLNSTVGTVLSRRRFNPPTS